MKIRHGSMYLTSIGDLDNPVMGIVVRRMWWKPWRYSVRPVYYSFEGSPGRFTEIEEGALVHNLTKLGVVGYLKLNGVKHQDLGE